MLLRLSPPTPTAPAGTEIEVPELRAWVVQDNERVVAAGNAAMELCEKITGGEIVAMGRKILVGHSPFSLKKYAEHEEIQCDRRWQQASFPLEWLECDGGWLIIGADRSWVRFVDVSFSATDIKARWSLSSSMLPDEHATKGDETRLHHWLAEEMRATPNAPRPKAMMREEATQAEHKFSRTSFDRAFTAAISEADAPDWGGPGRRRKDASSRET